ncbi:MAG: winged helix-turn-helix domain-containing protein [Pseudomonadota bacterium]
MGHRNFRFGEWRVDPDANSLIGNDAQTQVEPRAMDVLRYLCGRPGLVVPVEELLLACWGTSESGDNPVHKAITQLRRALGDASSAPRYIETIRKRGYRAIAEVIEEGPGAPGSWLAGSPFRGLNPFEEDHAAIFFGRAQATARLFDATIAQTAGGCALVLLLGPSGSGKTSLVRAGLLPQLMAQHAQPGAPLALACTLCLDCADLGGGSLYQALAAVLIDAELDGSPLFNGESADLLGRRLEADPASVLLQLRAHATRPRIGLFVDRLEAIFRLPGVNHAQHERFVQLLEQLARCGAVFAIVACRNDFYPELVAIPALTQLKARGGHVDLAAPDGAELAQIVREPARAASLRFERDAASGASLDDVLCDAARGSPDTLPLLQYCLDELYRQRGPDGALRFAVYHQLGGIEGALGARAEQTVAALGPAQVAALPHVLSQLVSVADGQFAATARRAPWSALRPGPELELVRALVEARLFVSELSADLPSFGVAHEALLRRWPRVQAWIEQHRHALQVRTRIGQQAARWDASARARDLLLPRGSQLNQARELLGMDGFSLNACEQDFVRVSIQRVRLAERLRLMMFALVTLLALLAGGLGIAARAAQQRAEQHRTDAEGLMGFMLGEFVDKLRPLGRLDLLDSVSARALAYLSASKTADASAEALTQRAKALQVIAEVNIARANSGAATEALLVAREILQRQVRAAPRDKALLKNLGANAFWLGQIEFDRNQWAQAERHFNDYSQFSDQLAALDPADADGWIEQSYAHNSLGSVALSRGAAAAAVPEFALSVALKTRALARTPGEPGLSADLADSLSWQASAELKLGRLDAALALYQQELELVRPLHAARASDALWSHRLAFAHWHQAELQLARGRNREAGDALAAAATLLDAIVRQDRSNREWQMDLYSVTLRRIDAEAEGGDPAGLLARLEALRQQLRALSALEPQRTNLTRLIAVTEQRQAAALMRLGQPGPARARLDGALAVLEKLQLATPGDQTVRESLAESWLLKSDFDTAGGAPRDALAACAKAQAVLAPLAATSTDFSLLAPRVRAQLCSGDAGAAAPAMKLLEHMSYREVHYLRYLATHPPKKGSI